MTRMVRSLLPMLLLTAQPVAAQAQRLPHPCDALAQTYAIKWCVNHESTLMDSVYVAAAGATVASYPAAQRDSVAALERAWLAQHTRAMDAESDPLQQLSRNLIAKRLRVFRLRHQILTLAAASDPERMRTIPVFLEWSAAQGDRGLVLTLTNTTERPIEIVVRLYDPESDRLDERNPRILPRGTIRIGWIEGWTWRPGMQVQLLHPQYAPLLSEAATPRGR